MSWTAHLQKAKAHLKSSRLEDALKEANEASLDLLKALRAGGDREYTVYDSRAAIYERQGKPKNALQDVKHVIKLAPTHWQGYARASRLFLAVRKLDEAVTMADMALSRLNANDSLRRQKLQELKDEVSEHRRRQIYHFGKLPVEIITAIFEMVTASDWTRVFTLWAVSQHWHNIALNTPNLWSILILTKRHPARHAQRWIERSKGRIREISFRSTLPRSTVKLDGLLWSHLRICKLENHDITEYVGGKSKLHRLSLLEELQLKDTSVNCDPLLAIPDSQLRRLTLDGARFSWDILASNHKNFTSLEVRLHLTPPSLEEVMAILESNPMLEQLVLDLDESGPLSSSSPPPLTLPKLHTLHLANTPWIHFFAVITMPSLETLRLSRIRRVDMGPLISQRPRLISMGVNSCIVSSLDILPLVFSSPTLRSLELTRVDTVAYPVLEALAGGLHPSTTICPLLEQLDVSHCPDVKNGSIVALLNSRNPQAESKEPNEAIDDPPGGASSPPLVRIKTLKADGCPQIQANFIPWFKARVETFSCVYMTKREASWRR
ncbi:F-box domain protein [Mycena venus]|uniref:F-box domain protein n=1 Tax=Mycena venus TaxID=2733690 RepID=A0A8H6YQ10_9AGAR|nr:F-box domain protein [Mycena venus]